MKKTKKFLKLIILIIFILFIYFFVIKSILIENLLLNYRNSRIIECTRGTTINTSSSTTQGLQPIKT